MQQKTTWMDYLIIGISLILLTQCSPTEAPLKTITYIYKNNSGKDLSIEVYNELGVNFISYNLHNGDRIETHTSRSGWAKIFTYQSSIHKRGDSVVIRFLDNKCLYYSSGVPNKDDIFNVQKYDNYSPELFKQSSFTLYYTITEQEYNQAVDCE